jgi:hypothetical protein
MFSYAHRMRACCSGCWQTGGAPLDAELAGVRRATLPPQAVGCGFVFLCRATMQRGGRRPPPPHFGHKLSRWVRAHRYPVVPVRVKVVEHE